MCFRCISVRIQGISVLLITRMELAVMPVLVIQVTPLNPSSDDNLVKL